ncbi:TPA: ISKra4 family transposase [Escherichia coli]
MVPTTYLVDTTLSNSSDSDQTVQAVRLQSFSIGAPADARRFGFVQKSDCHPERRLMAHLSAQGMQANQQIFFLSDGADNLRELQFGMYPESIHVLDWFHITMRLTVLMQYAKGLQASDPATGCKVLSLQESSKRYLWNGNVATALDRIDDCVMYCDDPELNYANLKALQKQLDEMYTYIRNNQMMIPNYGEMRRDGEPVSTAFVESTINEVIARRMAKKQQMLWSRKGAHYLLQTRTAVLNNELQDKFASWYPGCTIDAQSRGALSAMAA